MTVKPFTASATAIAESIPDSFVALVARVAASPGPWCSGTRALR